MLVYTTLKVKLTNMQSVASGYSILCLKCSKWICSMCAGVKLYCFQEILIAENVKGKFEREWSQKKSYVIK